MFFKAKKTFGQHFLQDKSVIEKIIQASDIKKGETVLEIGPGTGVLTEALVKAGAHIIAVEADHDLIEPLKERFGDAITLVEGDILKFDIQKLLNQYAPRSGKEYKLIANLPYNITSAVLEKFFTQIPRPSRMVLMIQKEVADRILAKPPDMSLLSVVCQLYGKSVRVANVGRGAFFPQPKVDSSVVFIDIFKPEPEIDLFWEKIEKIISLAKIGFSSRRKQLHGNLKRAGISSSEEVKRALLLIGQNPQARAENLTVEDWRQLEKILL